MDLMVGGLAAGGLTGGRTAGPGRLSGGIAGQRAQQGQFSENELGKRWGRVVTQGAPSNGGPRGRPQHGRWQGSLQASSSIPRTVFGRQLDVSQLVCALLRLLRWKRRMQTGGTSAYHCIGRLT